MSVVGGLYTRWFHRWALLLGWAAGIVYGSVAMYRQTVPHITIKLVNGAPVTVDEPAWCVVDHSAERFRNLEDLHHAGPDISLPVKLYGGSTEHVLLAQMMQWPFEDKHDHRGRPYLSIDATGGGGNCDGYGSAGALALADQVIAHGEALRAQARVLEEAEAEASGKR